MKILVITGFSLNFMKYYRAVDLDVVVLHCAYIGAILG
jgi:hypothetical protein